MTMQPPVHKGIMDSLAPPAADLDRSDFDGHHHCHRIRSSKHLMRQLPSRWRAHGDNRSREAASTLAGTAHHGGRTMALRCHPLTAWATRRARGL